MSTHIFVRYPCVSLICSPFLYRITSYAVIELMGVKKNERLRLNDQGGRYEPHQNNNPCPHAVRRPRPNPPHSRGLQHVLPYDKDGFPRNSPVEGIPLNGHASDPQVIRIERGPPSSDSDGDLEGALHHPRVECAEAVGGFTDGGYDVVVLDHNVPAGKG